MIHVITRENRWLYEAELIEHYRLRHEIYVGERKWLNLARSDGLERDQFDNDDATYVLSVDCGRVVGGSRLIPTVCPHLLSEVFAHLTSVRGLPRATDIYEWTRMFIVRDRREGKNMGRTAGLVICGVLEHCLSVGVNGLTALVEMWWLPRFHDMGWKVLPLGLPELINGEWSVAVHMPIDQRTLESTRAFHDIRSAALVSGQRPAPRTVAA